MRNFLRSSAVVFCTDAPIYIVQEVLHHGYELYRDERSGARYAVPDGVEVEAFREAIETLPPAESPELFGLHPNADLTFRTLQVGDVLCVMCAYMGVGGNCYH